MRVFARVVRMALSTMMLLFVVGAFLPVPLKGEPSGKFVQFVAKVSVPGPFELTRPFVDYMAVSGQTLYAAYTSHARVAALDTRTNQVAASIVDTGNVHGVAIDVDRNLGFASDGKDNRIAVFDLSTHKLVNRIAIPGEEPDAIIFDAKAALVYVANAKSASGTLIDPTTQSVVATIPLGGGGPEFCVADPNTGVIYQNLEESEEVVVIDPLKRAVISRFKLPEGQSPTGIALDASNHRLFVTGSKKKLSILNADTGAIIVTLPIGYLSDGVAYDSVLERAYTANGLGSITIVQRKTPDQYVVLETVGTRIGSHSVSVDPTTHRIYIASFGSILVYDSLPKTPQ
jgi:YVTN family beta-propeller protein